MYHLISRDPHGMMLQLLAGLITYLLLVLYCYQLYEDRKPSIRRLRELRRRIRRETGYHIYVVNIQTYVEAIALLLLFSIHARF